MRTTAAECAELGRIIAQKVNRYTAPVTVLIPRQAISVLLGARAGGGGQLGLPLQRLAHDALDGVAGLERGEGLDDVAGGASRDGLLHGATVGGAGDQDEWEVAQDRVRLRAFHQRQAVQPGHGDVAAAHDGTQPASQQIPGRQAVLRFDHLRARDAPQQGGQRHARHRVVFDNQNLQRDGAVTHGPAV